MGALRLVPVADSASPLGTASFAPAASRPGTRGQRAPQEPADLGAGRDLGAADAAVVRGRPGTEPPGGEVSARAILHDVLGGVVLHVGADHGVRVAALVGQALELPHVAEGEHHARLDLGTPLADHVARGDDHQPGVDVGFLGKVGPHSGRCREGGRKRGGAQASADGGSGRHHPADVATRAAGVNAPVITQACPSRPRSRGSSAPRRLVRPNTRSESPRASRSAHQTTRRDARGSGGAARSTRTPEGPARSPGS